ncbi:ABC transporter substrate-binding protein [Pseudomonas agarici]|uniref:ABC transporter substrate-binding protein n=1 Tax=Pseudomonas agarici TaxID=46677 RepID=A0A0X1SWN8_PSEAA|nr:ABC transporter substrate-binding protein [Pseudomonas agarici]AMB84306.1 ABC transporter substrate-binding protein [Pseudomonas agarici]NWB89498.1 ABC transporter substrate-binding protein [Pseudomonas agarici]NWC10441.1 ABC transporter substrate-binding protein [Pseudomonas agarici]SEK24213.1 amino acid ABC transporter substrate-binding protein, PAAT family [Pseudomonas agarici]
MQKGLTGKKTMPNLALTISLACMVPLLSAAEIKGTLKQGELSVGSDLTYPPYTYLDQKQPSGFDPEFMQLIGKQLRLEPRFLDTRFANLILGVNAQRFDVVASALYVTPERAKQVDFISYLKTGSSLMVLSASDFRPQRPEDLCGKRVGSIKGASWVPKLNKVSTEYCLASGKPAIQSREFPTSPEAAQALLAQAVDVQMEDPAVAKITVEKLQGKTVISSSELIYPVVIGLAVRKGNLALLGELTTALGQIKQNGSYGELLTRYNLAEPNAEEIKAALGTTTP